MDNITHEMRLMQWAPIIGECRSSGMAVRSWCIEHNINEKQFYYWQHRVRGGVFDTLKKAESQSQTNFVQLTVPINLSKDKPYFRTDMIIHIGNNILELSNIVLEELLSKVLKVMSDAK